MLNTTFFIYENGEGMTCEVWFDTPGLDLDFKDYLIMGVK